MLTGRDRADGSDFSQAGPIGPERDHARLTPGQERLAALSAGELPAPGLHLALVLALRGDLDVGRLQRALESVALEHDALRARLEPEPGGVGGLVSFASRRTFADLAPRTIDVETGQAVIDEALSHRFDLSREWSRFSLLRSGDQEHTLCFVGHRVGFDAWSLRVLERAIVDAYAESYAESYAQPYAEPARVVASGAALADWLRDRGVERTGAGWVTEVNQRAHPLRGEIPALDLPADRARPPVFSGRGGERSRALAPATVARLQALAIAREARLADVVLTAFLAWVQRRTNTDDPTLGVELPRTAATIGPFTPTGVLRVALEPTTPIDDAIARVSQALRSLEAAPAVDREEISRALGLVTDPSRTPLYQIAFDVEPAAPPSVVMPGLAFERVDFPSGHARTDLTLRLRSLPDGPHIGLEYASDLFDGARVEQMLDGLVAALEAITEGAGGGGGESIGRVRVMTPAERQRTLSAADVRPYDADRHTYLRFEAQVALAPDRPAVVFRDLVLTYGELNRRANRVAHRLIAHGVVQDSLVAIYCERSPEMLIAALAIMKAGGAYVPLDPSHPNVRTLAIVEDAAPLVLVTQTRLADGAPVVAGTMTIRLDDPTLETEPDHNPAVAVVPHALAYVIFTSGSTGRPKGVGIEHRSFTNFLASMAREPGFGPRDRVLSVTTLSFDIAGLELFLPLIVGGSVEIADAATCVDGARLAARLRDPAVTTIQGTPATFRLLLERGWSGKPGLRVLCGGEALQPDLIGSLLSRVGQVWNMYGPTETTVWSTVRRLTVATTPVSIGGPVDNTSVYVLSPLGEPVPFGAVGEIYIGGAGVARGYHGLVALSTQKFVPDPFSAQPAARMYQTGDLGRFLPDGSLTCLGRADFQIKIRGFRIETAEIEKAILAGSGVVQAVVTAWEPQPGDKRLVAYVVCKPGESEPRLRALRAELEQKLPAYMVPSFFVRLDALPLNASGKIDRRALPAPTLEVPESAALAPPPADDLEAQIHEAFGKALGVSRLGVDDNFFEVGGESILAARLARLLETSLGMEVPLHLLFESPTIRGLATRLRESSAGGPARPRVVVLRRGDGPRRLFCVCGIALYNHLAHALPADISVLGVVVPEETYLFDAANLRQGRATLPSVEDLAALYVEAIREEQPEGPYLLTGVSFGGVLAYEVARQLVMRGEKIAFLGLLDALLPQALRAGYLRRAWWRVSSVVGDPARLRTTIKLYGARLLRNTKFEWSPDDAVVLRDAIQDMAIARYAMHLRPFAGSALLVGALDRSEYGGIPVDPSAGWNRAVRGRLTYIEVSGRHLGILQPPNVAELASKMADYMNANAQRPAAERPAPAAVETA